MTREDELFDEITSTVRTADRLGVVRDEQRTLVVEPVRGGYIVHLVHNPPDLLDRPGAVRRGHDTFAKPVQHERGFILHSEQEWGPVSPDLVERLLGWSRTVATFVLVWKVHDSGRLHIVHVQHPTGTQAYRWKLHPLESLTRDKWPNRIDF